jgi:geranyl-CoA carboxylase beta subunit
MPTLNSLVNTQSSEFVQNAQAMQNLIEKFHQITSNVILAEEKSRPRYAKKGLLMPRERLNLLLDPGRPFLELCSLAGYKLFDDKDGTEAGAGCIAGIGVVSGIRSLIIVDNFAIKGGTITPIGLQKNYAFNKLRSKINYPLLACRRVAELT